MCARITDVTVRCMVFNISNREMDIYANHTLTKIDVDIHSYQDTQVLVEYELRALNDVVRPAGQIKLYFDVSF